MKIDMLNEMRVFEKTGKFPQEIFGECLLHHDLFRNNLNEAVDPEEYERVRDMIANDEWDEEPFDSFADDLKTNKRSPYLTHYSPEELRDLRGVYRLKDYPIGFALKDTDDGNVDIVGLHNNSEVGGLGDDLVRSAINHGGNQLDHFDGFLSDFYGRNGFDEYDRFTWDDQYAPDDWDYEHEGRPDVVLRRLKKEPTEKEGLNESSMSRITKWVKENEIAIITAWRCKLKDRTKDTDIPNHVKHEKKHRGQKIKTEIKFKDGEEFSTEEKKYYNRALKASLLKLGYGVTKIRGVFRECGMDTENEESFFVVNLNGDPNFKNNIFKLSEKCNQDCFLYSPKDSIDGFNIGTNNSDYPGYKNEEPLGNFLRDIQTMFMSRIGKNGFAFVDDETEIEPDKPQTFQDRKKARKNSLNEEFDVFSDYGIQAKRIITQLSKIFL